LGAARDPARGPSLAAQPASGSGQTGDNAEAADKAMASARRFMQMAEQDGRHPAVRPAPPTVLAPVAGRRGPGMAGGSLHPEGLMEIPRNAGAPQCDVECVPITAHCNQRGSESATRGAPAPPPNRPERGTYTVSFPSNVSSAQSPVLPYTFPTSDTGPLALPPSRHFSESQGKPGPS
jgi:hypothetical protein